MKVKEQVTQVYLDKEESEVWTKALNILERMEEQIRYTNDTDFYEIIEKAVTAVNDIHNFHIVLDGEEEKC